MNQTLAAPMAVPQGNQQYYRAAAVVTISTVIHSADRRPFGLADVALYALAVAGLAAALTLVFLGMRAVLDIGGFCAEGGPYVIETHCPDGVPLLMVGGIFGLFGFGGLMAATGARLGGPYGALVMLAWPALFLSLGWNFLEYAFWPPASDGGIIWGWLIPGVLFVIMGGGPLLAVIPLARLGGSRPSTNQSATLGGARGQFLNAMVTRAAQRGWTVGSSGRDAGDLVTQLERLAVLRESGALSALEFERAKSSLLEGRDAI